MTKRELPKLTPEQALAEVYRLTPQIRDIDDLLAPARMRWLPYTMFFQHPNYRSSSINTDALGFRISIGADGRELKVSDTFGPDQPINLVVGSSTAMGTGTSNDKHTMASCLSQLRNERWLNFAARAYNSQQELILYTLHQHRFAKVDQVMVLSGMNNLVLEGMPPEFRSDHGQYYYSYEYTHYMSFYNLAQQRAEPSLLKRMFGSLKRHTEAVITDAGIDTPERIARSVEATGRALAQWKALLAPHGAQLTYVLQPLATWAKEELTDEEAAINHAVDSCPNNFWRMFSNILGKEVYPLYVGALEQMCASVGVPFYDLNAMIAASPLARQNIFVDRLHFNDFGHHEVAKLLDGVLAPRASGRDGEPARRPAAARVEAAKSSQERA
jgi:hypothetical protein